jgi:hypothetical protein
LVWEESGERGERRRKEEKGGERRRKEKGERRRTEEKGEERRRKEEKGGERRRKEGKKMKGRREASVLIFLKGKQEFIGTARKQFGESPVDTAIRKLHSDFYGFFSETLEKFRSTCNLETADLTGNIISFTVDPVDLPENFSEEIEKLRTQNSGTSDGDLLFSAVPKFWAGPHAFVTPKFSEHDVRISVGPAGTQFSWLATRERPPAFLAGPTLYSEPLKLPARPAQPRPAGSPAVPVPAPTKFAKILNRPYLLTEEVLKTSFFGGLVVEQVKVLGRTIVIKFETEEDLAKALNADGMVWKEKENEEEGRGSREEREGAGRRRREKDRREEDLAKALNADGMV